MNQVALPHDCTQCAVNIPQHFVAHLSESRVKKACHADYCAAWVLDIQWFRVKTDRKQVSRECLRNTMHAPQTCFMAKRGRISHQDAKTKW